MENGLPGLAGVPVPCLVEEVPNREQEIAQTHPQRMVDSDVKGMIFRLAFATLTSAPVSAIGPN